MSFKITIEETREELRRVGREWRRIDTEEVERDAGFLSSDEPKTRIKEIYGYTPSIEQQVEVVREVLVQVVDELDLATVIKAINGI